MLRTAGCVQNGPMIVRSSRPVLALATALAVVVLVAGCGGTTPKKAGPTTDANAQTDVPVPTGVKLTAYGSELKFGQPALVAYAPNPERKSILQITVTSATQGSIADLTGYTLDERTRASTPFYIRVTVKNIGDGDVGRTKIPLYLVDKGPPETLSVRASSFNNTFAKCPSTPFPTTFAPQAQLSTCLVYLAPDHGSMSGVSYRDADSEGAPIVWTGTVTTPKAPVKAPAKNKKKAS